MTDWKQDFSELLSQRPELTAQSRELRKFQPQLEDLSSACSDFYELAPVGYCSLDETGRIRAVNPSAARLLGCQRNRLLRQSFSQFVITEDHTKLLGHFRRCRRTGGKIAIEVKLGRHGVSLRTVQLITMLARPMRRRLFYRTAIVDLTEREQALEAWRRAQAKYDALCNCGGAVTYEARPFPFRFTFVNGLAEQLLGFPRDRWLHEPVFWKSRLHPDDRGWAPSARRRAIADRTGFSIEYRLIGNDDRPVWVRDSGSVVLDEGKPAKIVGMLADITSRKHAESELADLHRDVETLIEERTQNLMATSAELLRAIAERQRLEGEIVTISEREQRRVASDVHDGICQQLTGITCMANVLKQRLAAKTAEETQAAEKICALLQEATTQAHNLAAGLHPVGSEPNGLPLALDKLASRISDMYQTRCRCICPRPVPVRDNYVGTQLYRIAQEAAHNAVKHGNAKKIQLRLVERHGKTILTVTDDGKGFTGERDGVGGLGLGIMEHRASVIGANLIIRPGSRHGTVVTCSLPASHHGDVVTEYD